MRIAACVDQLRVDPHAIAHALHAALHQMRDPELLRDLAQIARSSSFVLHHRCAADHFQISDFGEISQNLILHPVGEVGVLLFVAQIFERQDCDALFGCGCRRCYRSRARSSDRDGGCDTATRDRRQTPRQEISAHSKRCHDYDDNSNDPVPAWSRCLSWDRHRPCLVARLDKLLRHLRIPMVFRVEIDD